MSKALKKLATSVASTYVRKAPKSFFKPKIDTDLLEDIIVDEIDRKLPYSLAIQVMEWDDEFQDKFAKEQEEQTVALAKKTEAFDTELTEARAEFQHGLQLEKLAFDREVELKKWAMTHEEAVFVQDSKYTKEIVDKELANAKAIQEQEIATVSAKFAAELQSATELAASNATHAKTISDAAIAKAKAEANILYAYDSVVLEKRIKTEVADKYDELLALVVKCQTKEASLNDLVERLTADKSYFQSFSEARVDRSENVTDKLVDKINCKESPAIVQNFTEVKKEKKSKD